MNEAQEKLNITPLINDEKLISLEVIRVIKITMNRGTGQPIKDPVRQIHQYWDLDSNLIYDDDLELINSSASSEINS